MISFGSIVLTCCLSIFQVANIVLKELILHYALFKAQNKRPINTMIIIDQVNMISFSICNVLTSLFKGGQLLASTILGALVIVSILMDQPLAQIFDGWICNVISGLMMAYFSCFVINGFGMAVYRLIAVKFPVEARLVLNLCLHSAKSAFKFKFGFRYRYGGYHVMTLIYLAMSLSGSLIITAYMKGTMLSGRSSALAFCYGHSDFGSADPDEQIHGLRLKNLAALGGLVMMILELVIYLYLFKIVYIQNEAMKKVLTEAALQKRRQSNVVTLKGQMVCFAIESLSWLLGILVNNFGNLFPVLKSVPTAIFIITLQSPLVSLAIILTSSELRNYVSGSSKIKSF